MAAHFWFIPTERGRFLSNRQTCQACHTARICHLGQFQRPTPSAGDSIDELLEKTFPSLRQVYGSRLALEETIAADAAKLDAATRAQMIAEAFDLAEPHFTGGYGHEGRRILAFTLRPLWPSEEEIRACLQIYRKRRSPMGRRLRTAEVMAALYPESKPASRENFDY